MRYDLKGRCVLVTGASRGIDRDPLEKVAEMTVRAVERGRTQAYCARRARLLAFLRGTAPGVVDWPLARREGIGR